MRRFAIVCGQEFRETLKSRPFIVISVFLAVVLLAGGVIGLIFLNDTGGGFEQVDYTDEIAIGTASGSAVSVTPNYTYYIALDDRSGDGSGERLADALPYVSFDFTPLDDGKIEGYLSDGCDACIILNSALSFDIYEQSTLYGSTAAELVCEALSGMAKLAKFERLGVSPSDAIDAMETSAMYVTHSVGGYDMGKYMYNMFMIILMFLVIGLYGQMVATRVATEKSSRTMEVLATSVSPGELLCGKVFGVGLAGLLQILIFIGAAGGIIGGILSGAPQLSLLIGQLLEISGLDIFYLCCYFVLGFLMMAFVYGGLGSMVSQVEDLSGIASLPLYLFMVGYFISIASSGAGYVSTLMRIASHVPFWSPIVMFSRMSIEAVPDWEVALSLAILLLSCVGAAFLSARIYRSGMLRYGKPPKLKEIISAAKQR